MKKSTESEILAYFPTYLSVKIFVKKTRKL